jgi:putative transposase
VSGIRCFFHSPIPLGQTIFRGSDGGRVCSHSETNERITKEKCLIRNLKKSDCHIHATLKQRLDAIHLLRQEHPITRLCQVLHVNRSTYYKRFHQPLVARTIENQQLRQHILTRYIETKYRLGAAEMQIFLKRDYGITISVGRVYLLMKSMDLPKMSTSKPTYRHQKPTVSFSCPNLLKQRFQPKAPNQAWVSDISYILVKRSFIYVSFLIYSLEK